MSASQVEKKAMSATGILYRQTEDGDLELAGTATAFEKTKTVIRFLAAAHCVAEDDVENGCVKVENFSWYITFDEPTQKNFLKAKLVAVGYQHAGDDFAIMEINRVDLRDCPIIPLAKKNPVLGEEVINIAAPLGLGKQLFRGHVSKEEVDRPFRDGDESADWRGTVLLQLDNGPGSSGSSVVSKERGSIVAILVGGFGDGGISSSTIAVPIEKFLLFWKNVKAKKYPFKRSHS